jgi:hypothetical protein
MFAVIAGIVLALFFLGLPLGIIGLFVVSVIDQKSMRASRRDRKLTAIGQTIIVRFPEQQAPTATTKRREQLIVWRNPDLKPYMSTRAGGKQG